MKKLIASGFRIFFLHSWSSWLTVLVCPLLGMIGGFFGMEPVRIDSNGVNSDMLLLTVLPALLLVLFVMVFVIGQEQSGGTVRNKLISGHTKCSVFLAWMICALAFAALCAALYAVPYLIFSRKALAMLGETTVLRVILTLLLLFLTVGAAGGMFSLLFSRQAAASFLTVSLGIVLYMTAAFVSTQLTQEKYNEMRISKHIDTETGTVREDADGVAEEPTSFLVTVFNRNPNYVDSPLREVCIILNKLNPAEALSGITETLESIRSAQQLDEAVRMRDGYTARLHMEIEALAGNEDEESEQRLLRLRTELEECESGQQFGYISEMQDRFEEGRSALDGKPQCMAGILLAFCAAGLGIFRKKNVV